MRSRPVLFGAMVVVTSGVFFACGSRSALPGDLEEQSSSNDDSGGDARRPRDAGPDTSIPPIDAKPPFDANRTDCPDADATLVYLMTVDNQLLSFFPTDGSFRLIGNIACPAGIDPTTGNPSTPFSMAVDRKGVAYVEFSDGELFKVSTVTAACAATAWIPDSDHFSAFGMSFSTNAGGPAETLFIAGGTNGTSGDTNPNTDFASIAIPSFAVTDIGPFQPLIEEAELAGTGDGRLFAFWAPDFMSDANISEIDKTSGNIIGTDSLPGVTLTGGGQSGGWAFGFWGGDFYTFTGSGSSSVTRFRPSDKSITVVATYPSEIVGAGVSTCAPQQ